MSQIIDHVVSITVHRDRPLVDTALVSALIDLLCWGRRIPSMKMYRSTVFGKKRILTLAAWNEGTVVHQVERELEDSEVVPELRCALESGVISSSLLRTSAAGTERRFDATHWIPLSYNQLQFGCLELQLRRMLNKQQLAQLEGICGLYCNYLSLLTYSQMDTLTGLLNRKTFDENLDQLLADKTNTGTYNNERRQGHGITHDANWLAVADLDFFKRINDTYGHLVGDAVLVAVADIMRDVFRRRDKLFRFGGEEFIITLRNTTRNNAVKAFERFRQRVEAHNFPTVGRVTVSLGATRVKSGDNPTLLLGRADNALYEAKNSGRNRVLMSSDEENP